MSSNHQRAKEIFSEVVELPKNRQADRLRQLCGEDESLFREVSSLLDFHTARSLVAEKPTPKIKTRSTLSTTRLDKPWHRKLLRYVPSLLPLVCTLLMLAPLLLYISSAVSDRDRAVIGAQLKHVADARSTSLQLWGEQTQGTVRRMMEGRPFQNLVSEFLNPEASVVASTPESEAGDPTSVEWNSSADRASRQPPWQQTIESALLAPAVFMLWDNKLKLVAATPNGQADKGSVNQSSIPIRGNDIRRALAGELIIRIPDPQQMELPAPLSNQQVSIFCPVTADSSTVKAILLIQCHLFDDSLKDLVRQWNSDEATLVESYIVDSQGHLLSKNRYPEHLSRLKQKLNQGVEEGPREKQTNATEGLLLRDPGIDLISGGTPANRPANWPLTMAAFEISHQNDGWNADGYRNYAGQSVVGAWRWLPRNGVGLIFETPRSIAYQFSTRMGWLLSSIFAVCLLGSLVSAIAMWPKRRTNNLRSVGPYQIQELLGKGGMGAVYLAEHSLLCRPTAIKILTKENAELSVLIRFEREVQLASQLTHPNTIAIYDFGRNEDGVFYYAMEYIDGGHIGELVEFEGPLPAGRCIYIVKQLCFALREAHLAGVVHRDIKPQNVMVCDRGGEPDFVKLVDYGLVKAFAPGINEGMSQTKIVMGTPRFMAPERLQSPWLADPRVDIYSIGGLLYFMLTAELPPLVAPTGSSDHVQLGVDTLDLQTSAVPFGSLLSHCMSYDPAARPSSVASLLQEFEELSDKFPWTRDDSEHWWKKRGSKFKQFLANKRKSVKA